MARISYYGHSCFEITSNQGYRIVLDPYEKGSVPGVEVPQGLTCDIVYCSHEHQDHNARHIVSCTNKPLPEDIIEIDFLVPHDEEDGQKRGFTKVHCFIVDGKKIVHFGDIGRTLHPEEKELLQGVDVILIPAGGFYTIDALQAKEIIDVIQPKCSILMHYRSDSFGFDVLQHIDTIKEVFGDIKQLKEGSFEVGKEEGILTLTPIQ